MMSVIDGSFLYKQAVPLLHPLILLIEHRGGVDQRVVELVHMSANLGADRHAAHGLEQLLSLWREHEIHKCSRRLRIGGVACDADALWARDHRLHRHPIDRRAATLERLGVRVVRRKTHGNLARGDELGEEHVALAHAGLLLDRLAERARFGRRERRIEHDARVLRRADAGDAKQYRGERSDHLTREGRYSMVPSALRRTRFHIQEMSTKTTTAVTHYHIQKKRRAEFIEDWRKNRRSVIRKDDVVLQRTARGVRTGVYMGSDGDSPTRCLDALVHEIDPGVVSTIHRHSWDAQLFIVEGSGWTEIDGVRYPWKPWDAIHIPAWAWHRSGNDGSKPARFMSYSAEPMLWTIGMSGIEERGPEPFSTRHPRPQFSEGMAGDDPSARRLRR